ncbi:O-antigen ligase family protein [Patescibacteria group bacterium]|nr:O-antigen ligase family protein [Patescibacteria group bacterium]
MIKASWEKFLRIIIKLGSGAILFLPLFVYQPVLYPYIFSKIIVFQIIVEILLVTWLFLLIYGPRKYRLNFRQPFLLSLSIFILVLIISSLAGVDLSRSWWSIQERMTGIITLLHFYLWFLILASVFSQKKDWLFLIKTTLISSFLVGLYGLGQKIGFSFLLKDGATRMSATLGNPDFLGVYSLLHVFLASILFIETKKIWKFLGVFLALFNLVILFLAATRGAILALGFVIFALLFFLFFCGKTKKILKVFLLILFLILIGAGLFLRASQEQEWFKKVPLPIKRMTRLSPSENTTRLKAWQIGLQAFQDRPFLGWGVDNYNVAFNRHYDPWYLTKGDNATWFDKTHNQVIDLLACTGILGTLAYLSIFFFLLWFLRKKYLESKATEIRAGPSAFSIITLILLFVAYFIQNLFVFDTPSSLILFYFALAFSYFILQSRTAEPVQDKKNAFPLPLLIFLILLIIPWLMFKVNLEPWQKSKLGIRGVHFNSLDFPAGMKWYGQALEGSSFVDDEIRLQLAKQISEKHAEVDQETTDADLQVLAQATELTILEFEESIQAHPQDVRYFLFLGQLYNLASVYRPEYLEKAQKILEKAQELSPRRQQIYFALGRTHLSLGNYQKAQELFQEAYLLEPGAGLARNNLMKVLRIFKENNVDLATDLENFIIEENW